MKGEKNANRYTIRHPIIDRQADRQTNRQTDRQTDRLRYFD